MTDKERIRRLEVIVKKLLDLLSHDTSFSIWDMEVLLEDVESLEKYKATQEDPSPCCYAHDNGALSSHEPCPEIAENE